MIQYHKHNYSSHQIGEALLGKTLGNLQTVADLIGMDQ